jgi:MoaA/NifB/PqqE/SkfB family radical SAM enzyme
LHELASRTRQVTGYALFAFRFFLLRSKGPFFLGLVTNDTCNLDCINCRVANVEKSNMSFDKIREVLVEQHRLGLRFLTLAGGEPYLWRDRDLRIRDIVDLARSIGYLNVNIFTNGTIPLDADTDFTWVSIDGLGKTLARIRGIREERIFRNLRRLQGRFGPSLQPTDANPGGQCCGAPEVGSVPKLCATCKNQAGLTPSIYTAS